MKIGLVKTYFFPVDKTIKAITSGEYLVSFNYLLISYLLYCLHPVTQGKETDKPFVFNMKSDREWLSLKLVEILSKIKSCDKH